jgi:hypothetical protein
MSAHETGDVLAPTGMVGMAYPPRERAPHIGHGTHLCHMAESGEFSLEQIRALVKDPKFICKKCGRVAAKAENLCEPVPL